MDRSLQNLDRNELVTLLVNLSDECEELIAENERLKHALAAQRQQQMPRSAKVGSIAQAALEANGYFEAAQRSADDYLREIKYLRDELSKRVDAQRAQQEQAGRQAASEAERRIQADLQEAHARANGIVGQARQQADSMVEDARRQAQGVVAQANEQAESLLSRAREEAGAMVAKAQSQVDDLRKQLQDSAQVMASAETAEIFRPRGRHAKG